MKITVLVDNNTTISRYFLAEPAFSLHIEVEGKKILFDAGYSDIFIKNAQKMGINLLDIDYIALSHGHLDHTWGLLPLIQLYTEAVYEKKEHKKPELITHPLSLISKTKGDFGETGSLFSEEKLSVNFNLKLSKKPVWITENLVFLGEISRQKAFEDNSFKTTLVYKDKTVEDYMSDDSALAYKTPDGIIVITGCSHSGICNIIEQAKKICNDDRVIDVIGGFHLLNPSKERIENTVEYFKSLNLKNIHPCHCTDLQSKIALSRAANVCQVGVGSEFEY